MLAKMYFYGQGTYRDGKQALYWIDQSIQRGSGGAVKLKPKICNRYRSAAFASQSCSENLNKDSKSSEVMWAVKRSNVRIGPGTSYSKIGLLEPGEAVGVIEQTGKLVQTTATTGAAKAIRLRATANPGPTHQCSGMSPPRRCASVVG